jgi:hypothetical protein
MKARITIVFGTAVMALALAGGALAAPQQSAVRSLSHGPSGGAKTWSIGGADYTRPSAVTPHPWAIRGSYDAVKPNPSSARGSYDAVKPNPSGARGSYEAIKTNRSGIRLVHPNPMGLRGSAMAYKPNPTCIRGAAAAF